MTFTPFGRIDLAPIYSILKILDVEQVFYLETCKFMYKLKTDLLPINIGSYFDVSCSNTKHSYNLRKRGTLTTDPIVEPRLSSGKKSIKYRGEIIWDKISDDIKDSRSVFSLKRKIKKNLLE